MAIETSIVVVFGDGVSSTLQSTVKVEIDPEHTNNLDADGKLRSNFYLSHKPVFLIQYPATLLKRDDIKASSGSVTAAGTNITQSRTKDISFIKIGATDSLGYGNITSPPSITWQGNTGVVTLVDDSLELTGGAWPCIGTATFETLFNERWMLTPPGGIVLAKDATWEIIIAIYMSEIVV